jgi:trigger factor
MEVDITKLEKSEVKLTIELTAEEMAPYEKKAVEVLQGQVKVDGFREGNIPREVLEKHIGEQAFKSHVLDIAVSETYETAIRENDVRPIEYPKLSIVSHDPLKYEATVPVIPEVKWKKDVAGLTVSKGKLKVEKEEVQEVLDQLKSRSTKWNDVERAAKKGDKVEVDFDGFDKDGVALEGTSSKNHPIELGKGMMIPGFEEEIIGMKPGEDKEFEITFPKDYHADQFKGKKVKFKIKLHKVQESEEPTLDDEFAKTITGGHRKTIKELEEEITEELMKQKEKQEIGRMENDFLKGLADYVDVEISQTLIDRETDLIIERMKQDLQHRGTKWEDYEKEMEEKGKNIRDELKATAEEQVRIRLGLEKLYEEQEVEVTEKDLDAEIEDMLGMYPKEFRPMMEERFKEGSQEREQIRARLMLRKMVEKYTK